MIELRKATVVPGLGIPGSGHPGSVQPLLKDISVTFESGKVSAILGVSGCGKTTLLQALMNQIHPQSGEVYYDGKLLGPKDLPSGLGVLFQSATLFPHLTVLENLTLAPVQVLKCTKAEAQHQALALLKEFGLEDKAAVYPQHLSGGEIQRVALARALAMKPGTLILDEPTTALNKTWVLELGSLLRGLADQGMTIVLSTHDLNFAQQVADALFVMEDGALTPMPMSQPAPSHRVRETAATKGVL